MSEKKLIPLTSEAPSLCETSCDSACCRKGITIALYPDEAIKMIEEYGANITKVGDNVLFGYGSYELVEDCPNLVDDGQNSRCAVWETGWRPEICADFEAGSEGCDFIRTGGYFPSER